MTNMGSVNRKLLSTSRSHPQGTHEEIARTSSRWGIERERMRQAFETSAKEARRMADKILAQHRAASN